MARWRIRRAYNWDMANVPERKVDLARRNQEQFNSLVEDEWEPFSACPDLNENAIYCTIVWFRKQEEDA